MRSLHHAQMILHVKNKSYFVIAILKVENLKEAFSHFQMDSIVLFPEKSRKTSWHERYFRAKWKFLHQTPQISPIPSKIIFPRAALRKYRKIKVSIEFLWGVEPCIGLLASSNDWFQQLGLFLDFSHFLQGNLLTDLRFGKLFEWHTHFTEHTELKSLICYASLLVPSRNLLGVFLTSKVLILVQDLESFLARKDVQRKKKWVAQNSAIQWKCSCQMANQSPKPYFDSNYFKKKFWQNYFDCTCSFDSISPTEFSSKKGRKSPFHFQHSVNMHCLDDFRWELSSYFHCQCADQRGLEEGKVASCCRDRGGASDVGVVMIITITVQEQHLVPPTGFWPPTTFQKRQYPTSHWIHCI